MKELDLHYPQCPVRNVIARFGDKWSLLIICNVHEQGKIRYKELKKQIPDISHKMLTNTLRKLEEDHLLIRKAYAEIPPRVEYSLTEMGLSLMPVVKLMIEWAQTHFAEITE